MKRKCIHLISLLIFLHCCAGFDLNDIDNLKQLRAAADEEAPDIRITTTTPCSILVDWNCVAPCSDSLTGFIVYWQESTSKEIYNDTVSKTANFYRIPDLLAKTEYSVWVSSVKLKEEHASDKEADTTRRGVPFPINDVTAEEIDGSIEVKWTESNNPCPIKGYRVDWTGTPTWDPTLTDGSYTETSKTDTSAYIDDYLPSTDYNIMVNEITTDDKTGSASNPVTCTTQESSPGPPQFASSKTLDSKRVTVNWKTPASPNGEITGYQITCTLPDSDEDQCGHVPQIEVSDSDDYSYNVTDLLDCGNYTFEIKAINSAGIGDPANTDSRTDAGRPGIITNFQYTNVSDTTVSLSWEMSGTNCPVQYYRVSGSGEIKWKDDTDDVAKPFQAEGNSYILEGLIPYTSYSLMLQAKTEGGRTVSNNRAEFDTEEGEAGPPATVLSTTIDETSVRLVWTPPVDKNGVISEYSISCKRSKRGEDECNLRKTDPNKVYTIPDLKPCGNYTFEVSAINGYGPGKAGSHESTTDAEAPPDINEETFSVTGADSTTVDITFEAPSTSCPLTYYIIGEGDILWSNGIDPVDQNFTVDEAGTVTHTIVGLTPYTNYTFNFTGISDGGSTNYLIFNQQTEEDKPSAPYNLEAAPVEGTTDVKITWETPDINAERITRYQVIVSKGEKEIINEIFRSPARNTYTIKGTDLLTPCDRYKISLSARNDQGWGDESSDHSEIYPDLPNKPTKLECSPKGPNDIEITWNIVEKYCRIESYEAELSGYVPWDLTTVNASDSFLSRESKGNRYTITDLIPETEYEIKLAAVTEAGPGKYATECKAVTWADAPEEPLDLMVIDRSKSSITIRWKDPEMKNGYLKQFHINVTSKDDSFFHTLEAKQKTTESEVIEYTYEIEDLDDDVNYRITVTAENAAGLGASEDTDGYTEKSHLAAILGTVIPVVVIIIIVIGGTWYYKSHSKKKKISPDN